MARLKRHRYLRSVNFGYEGLFTIDLIMKKNGITNRSEAIRDILSNIAKMYDFDIPEEQSEERSHDNDE